MNTTGTEHSTTGHRLRNTPMTDLVRGRVSGRLDLEATIADAGLVGPLADLVRRVAKRTRLPRLERVDVARDLAEHFRDGLAAGTDEETLIRDFGDERAAAQLLRRSMVRKRPLLARVGRRFVQAGSITMVVVVGLYAIAAANYWRQRPIIRTDYVAQLNAPIAATPESERAWPGIRGAMTEIRMLVDPVDSSDAGMALDGVARDRIVTRFVDAARLSAIEPWSGPDEDALGRQAMEEDAPTREAVDGLFDRVEPALEQLRVAAALPALGREVTTGLPSDPADVAFFGFESRVATAGPTQAFDSVLAIELPHYPTIRNAGRLLATDARRAVAAGDGERAVADLEAAMGLARQVRTPSFLIGQLVGSSIEMLAFDVVLDAMATHPDAFTDADLERIAGVFAVRADDRSAFDLANERLFFEDLAQRFYTDDGEGNGHLTLHVGAGIGALNQGGGLPLEGLPTAAGFLFAPALANLSLDRRTAMEIWNDFFDRCDEACRAEPWQVDRASLSSLDGRPLEETMADWRGRLKYFPLNLIVPAIDNAVLAMLATESQRDLVETVIALERTRRRVGEWPPSLSVLPTDLLAEPARDPFDGEILRYGILDGVPVIWTIGPDRRDDGGLEIEDRRDPEQGRRRIDSPSSLASLSDYWGVDQDAERELVGDVVVWRGR